MGGQVDLCKERTIQSMGCRLGNGQGGLRVGEAGGECHENNIGAWVPGIRGASGRGTGTHDLEKSLTINLPSVDGLLRHGIAYIVIICYCMDSSRPTCDSI